MLIIYISKKLTCHTCDTKYGLLDTQVTCVENPGSSVVLETKSTWGWISEFQMCDIFMNIILQASWWQQSTFQSRNTTNGFHMLLQQRNISNPPSWTLTPRTPLYTQPTLLYILYWLSLQSCRCMHQFKFTAHVCHYCTDVIDSYTIHYPCALCAIVWCILLWYQFHP